MNVYPTSLDRIGDDQLLIQWNDGQRRQYHVIELREQCPCATCREHRKGDQQKSPMELPVLSLEEAQPLRISSMKPIGSYAYGIQFSDGHDSGIFTFELLRELGVELATESA